jgi:micrococcal nuclease
MRRATLILLLAVAALAAGLTAGRDGDAPAEAATGRVVRVVDGDTVRVALGGREEPVRYIGIDTPETHRPDTPVQCYARRAARENARLVAGERVRLVTDVERRDRFGRLLAYVYRARDGHFVNAALVRGGFARTLTIEPNVRFAARFARLAAEARLAGRGLWGACGRA